MQKDFREENQGSRPSLLVASVKIGIIIVPAVVLQMLVPAHPKIMFSIGMVLGILLQAVVPPRGKGLLPLLGLAGMITLVLYFMN